MNQCIQNNQTIVPVYVKLAYTCTFNTYIMNTNVSISDFIQNIKNNVYLDSTFNISPDTVIQVIQAGQYKQNSKPEEAEPVLESDEIVGTRFGKTPAFYIRLLQ